jgi:UTP--glucose-1-phosphate uridylyltransferase
MIDAFHKDNHSQILVDNVADEDVHKYGIAKLSDASNEDDQADVNVSFKVAGFVEKPSLAEAPSKLAVVGRYVFSNQIFDYLANTTASVGGEIQLTDAIDALISKYGVNVTTMRGDSYDAGDMRSYMQAFIYFAEQQLADEE